MFKFIFVILLITGCKKTLFAMLDQSHHNVKKEKYAIAGSEVDTAAALFERAFGSSFKRKFIELPATSQATRIPKSGYWYPQSTGGTNVYGALDKYDRAFHSGKNMAGSWESSKHSSRIQWAGHCNGMSAAAIRHQEPVQNVLRGGIVFTPYDIKALLSEIYMSAGFAFTGGGRCESNPGSPAYRNPADLTKMGSCEDINPAVWHLVVSNWIGIKKQSVIFDKNGDNQVWNYPLYSYSYTAQEISSQDALSKVSPRPGTGVWPFNPQASKFFEVIMQVKYTKEGQTEILSQTLDNDPTVYRYVLELDVSGNIVGGEWELPSQGNHPDFLWIPLEPKAGDGNAEFANPHIDPDEVLQMWAESRGLKSPEEEPPPYDIVNYDSGWGAFDQFRASISGVRNGTSIRGAQNILTIEPVPGLIYSQNDQLEILVNGKAYLKPILVPGSNVEVPINLDPGFSKITLNWNTAYFGQFSKELEVYTME